MILFLPPRLKGYRFRKPFIAIIVLIMFDIMMANNTVLYKNSKSSKVLFAIGVFTSLYWITGIFGAYTPVRGGVLQFLWILMVLSVLILPMISFIFVIWERTCIRSLNLITLLITLGTLLILMNIS
jgi:hypothetical protein